MLEKVDAWDTPEEISDEDEDWEVDPDLVNWPTEKIADGRVRLKYML